jgi:hypothetical protein
MLLDLFKFDLCYLCISGKNSTLLLQILKNFLVSAVDRDKKS